MSLLNIKNWFRKKSLFYVALASFGTAACFTACDKLKEVNSELMKDPTMQIVSNQNPKLVEAALHADDVLAYDYLKISSLEECQMHLKAVDDAINVLTSYRDLIRDSLNVPSNIQRLIELKYIDSDEASDIKADLSKRQRILQTKINSLIERRNFLTKKMLSFERR